VSALGQVDANGAPPSPLPRLGGLDEVTRGLVGLHKQLHGRGPVHARSFISGDALVCVLGGGFSQTDRALVTAGEEEVVRGHREAIGRVERERFAELVRELMGRPVLSHLRDADPAREVCVEVFLLG